MYIIYKINASVLTYIYKTLHLLLKIMCKNKNIILTYPNKIKIIIIPILKQNNYLTQSSNYFSAILKLNK